MSPAPILVVDDEADMRSALVHALDRSGFAVDSASSGADALARVKKDAYSMVITDVKMPEMSGMEVLGAVKRFAPQIPVIMITAYGTINNAVAAMQAGAADYILKPFSFETLENTVKKVFGTSNGGQNNEPRRDPINAGPASKQIITADPKVRQLLQLARNVAASSATVLIQGESGTGKELLAAYIHEHSLQKNGPYIAVNCAALPETLAESELFGHEKGAFTGAVTRKIGKFELAKHGTLVLDEISEMALPLQAKLLRVLQEKEVDRIGGSRPIPVDARVIAISNIDLKKAVQEGKFRQDLYYRVNVVPLCIPPLRERGQDIGLLANHFLARYSRLNRRPPAQIPAETLALLQNHRWKGNIRELENAIERAILIGGGDAILPEHLMLVELDSGAQPASASAVKVGVSVREMEKELIIHTLKEVNDNRSQAAELLGISIRTLRNKLREYRQHEGGGLEN